jgi:hypothetical protein
VCIRETERERERERERETERDAKTLKPYLYLKTIYVTVLSNTFTKFYIK